MKKVIFRRKGNIDEWEVDGDFDARVVLNMNREPRLVFEHDAATDVIDLRKIKTIVMRGKVRQREWMVDDFLSRAPDFRGAFLFAPGGGSCDIDGGELWFTDVETAARAGINVERKRGLDMEITRLGWARCENASRVPWVEKTSVTADDAAAVWRVIGRRRPIIISRDWHDRRVAWIEDGCMLTPVAEITDTGETEPVSGKQRTFSDVRLEIAPASFIGIPDFPGEWDLFYDRMRPVVLAAIRNGAANFVPNPERDDPDEILRVAGVPRHEAELVPHERMKRIWWRFAHSRDRSYWAR